MVTGERPQQFGLIEWAAGLIGQQRSREGRFGQCGESCLQLLDQPRARLRHCGAGLGDLHLDRVEPGRIGLGGLRQQPVALAQGGFEPGGIPGMRRLQREDQPVEKASP
jgi:hypothetical protein